MTYGDSEHVVRHKSTTIIHPEVRAELERLGVDDLPWCPADGGVATLTYWNESLEVSWKEDQGFAYYDHFDKRGRVHGLGADGGPLAEKSPGVVFFKAHINLARARHSPTDEKPPETPSTAFEKAERLLSHLKPSNVTDTRRMLLGGNDEVGLLRLAVMEGMPDYRKTTREKHEAICAALVMLRETLARTGLTHADKDAAILAAAEKLEEVL